MRNVPKNASVAAPSSNYQHKRTGVDTVPRHAKGREIAASRPSKFSPSSYTRKNVSMSSIPESESATPQHPANSLVSGGAL